MVDFITSAIATINYPPLTTLMKFINEYFYFIIIILFLMALYLCRKDKKKFISLIVSFIITLLMPHFLKPIYSIERPCATNLEIAKIECPPDYSFPSGHAAVAAFFVTAFLDNFIFFFYLFFYILTSFMRVYLGVHTLSDVIASGIIGMATYSLVENFVIGNFNFKFLETKKEFGRKLIHLMFGIFAISLLLILKIYTNEWKIIAILFFFSVFCGSLVIISLTRNKIRIKLFEKLFLNFGGRDRYPAEGAMWYFLGMALMITFLQQISYMIASIFILAIGDGISTLFNVPTKRVSPSFFKNKTPLSIGAFVVASLPILLLVGVKGIPLILLCATAEALKTGINDNFLLPLICVLYFSIV